VLVCPHPGSLVTEPPILAANVFFFFLSFFVGETGLPTWKAGTLLLEASLQSILLWLFWGWGLLIYLPGLALNHYPPDLSLPNSLGLQV
jgi:hypothetical protein